MRLNKEQVLEKFMWQMKLRKQRIEVVACVKLIIAEFKITRMSNKKRQKLVELIERVRRRIKMRYASYKKNLKLYSRQCLCCDNLIQRWINAGLIDPRKKDLVEKDIRKFSERDFVMAHGLSNDQVPTDPAKPIYSMI